MDMSSLWNLQGQLFLLLMMGLVLQKYKILGADAKTTLTNLVIDLILPCNIINSFRMEFSMEILKAFLIILLVAVGIQIFCLFLSRILYNNKPEGRKKVLQYATVVSNAGFMGNPIAESVFGAQGLLYASVYLLPQRIVMWSAGLACFTESPDRKTLVKKIATHPCIVSVGIGLVLMLTQLQLPNFLGSTIKMVGSCTTPISMILIGTILADVKPREMVNVEVLWFSFIRLALIPGAAYIVCRLLQIDPLITGVSVLLAAMPGGSTTAILASKYQGDYVFATKIVVCSTLLTLVSIPVWCMILA